MGQESTRTCLESVDAAVLGGSERYGREGSGQFRVDDERGKRRKVARKLCGQLTGDLRLELEIFRGAAADRGVLPGSEDFPVRECHQLGRMLPGGGVDGCVFERWKADVQRRSGGLVR